MIKDPSQVIVDYVKLGLSNKHSIFVNHKDNPK